MKPMPSTRIDPHQTLLVFTAWTANEQGESNPDLNDQHSDPLEIGSKLCIPDIAHWGHQQVETHWKYTDLANVVHDVFSIILHDISVESGFSLGRDVISRSQTEMSRETVRKKWL
jgi:hypothetical protein